MTTSATAKTDDPFLKITEVEARTGLSRTTIWRMRQAGKFPEPYQYSPGKKLWRESQITDWLANLSLAS